MNEEATITPVDNKCWEDTEEVRVTVTIETKGSKRVFVGNCKLGARVNRIED